MSDLENGASKTVLASEVLAGRDDRWGDDDKMDGRGIWAFHMPGSANYSHYDTPNSEGSGSGVGDTLPDDYCLPAVGMPCASGNSDWSECHAAARSAHAGGVWVVFADQHMTFYTEEVDLKVWRAIASIELWDEPVNISE